MPYRVPTEPDHLPLPSNPDYWVKMKPRARFGDTEAANAAMIHVVPGLTPDSTMPDFELSAYGATLATRLIVEWNLTDENDQLLPISRESIESLDAEDGEFLVREAQKRSGKRSEAEAIPFAKPSGRRSKDGQ